MTLIKTTSGKNPASGSGEHNPHSVIRELFNTDSTSILKNFIHTTPNIPYLYDAGLKKYFFLANQLEETLGYQINSRRELNREDLVRMMHPDDAKSLDDYSLEVLKKKPGTFLEIEYRLKDKAGDWRWFMVRETMYQTEQMSFNSIIFGVATDITNLKQTENLIRQQHNLNKSILENTHCSVFALDRNCCYIAFNSLHKNNMKNLLGVEIKTGMNFIELFPPAEAKNARMHAERVLSGETFSINARLDHGEPVIRDYEITYSPIKDETDFITGFSVFARDVTENVTKHSQLRSIEKQFMDVFENSPDAIFIEDSSGTILDINIAASSIQGFSRNYLLGNSIRNLVPKERYRPILREYKLLFLGAIKRIESTVWSATKGEVPVEITGKKIPFNNGYALMLIVRDISERKKLEEERAQHIIEKGRRREQLMKVSLKVQEKERNRIAAEMHDELGAGLSKISVMCQVIKKCLEKTNPVAVKVEKILEASEEVQRNISEIIWAMDPEKDTLANLVAYINYFASEYLESGSVDLDIKLPKTIPNVTVIGKIRRNIFLIIKESLNNIIKHAGASRVNIFVHFENSILSVRIKDNGNGFDPCVVSPFSNGINNFKKRVAEINGSISIDSGQQGTTIGFVIPIPATN